MVSKHYWNHVEKVEELEKEEWPVMGAANGINSKNYGSYNYTREFWSSGGARA